MDLNLDYLIDQIWRHLNLLRIYTKKRGEYPDFDGGLIVRKGASVEHVVRTCLYLRETFFSFSFNNYALLLLLVSCNS